MLTGEPLPITASRDTRLMSGSANLDGALTVRSLAPASESQYARIVALVRSAQASKAPLQRVADRYAVWFTPATLAVCAIAYLVSGDWLRVLAVLAVATPCPLILATPVAVIGGINRAARRHIIMRHGTALERLGRGPHPSAGIRRGLGWSRPRAAPWLRPWPRQSSCRPTCGRGRAVVRASARSNAGRRRRGHGIRAADGERCSRVPGPRRRWHSRWASDRRRCSGVRTRSGG